MAVASAGHMQICISPQTDNHASIPSASHVVTVIISASLSVNVASVSANDVDLSTLPSVGRSVWLSLCVSGKCTVAKRLIGCVCRTMVSRVGRGMGVLDGAVIVEGNGVVLGGEFGVSHCNQCGLCCIVVGWSLNKW